MKSIVIAFFLMIPFVSSRLIGQQNINYGETITGSISVDGEVDVFTFNGNLNDKIIIIMTENSGSSLMEPKIELFSPSGSLISTAIDNSQAGIRTLLASSGSFTFFVSDNGGDDTGNYAVFIQRTFIPGEDSLVQYGNTTSSSILTDGDIDTYTFVGSSGDKIIMRMTESSGSSLMEPFIELFDPAGDSLTLVSDGAQAEIRLTLTSDGIYTLFASDTYPGDDNGNYALFIQRPSNPGNDVSMQRGETVSGSLFVDGDVDTYSFMGATGDSVIIRMTENSGSSLMEPFVELFNQSGEFVTSSTHSSQAEIGIRLQNSGKHTIFASDSYPGDDTGNYSIFLFGFPTAIENSMVRVPSRIDLSQNFPNPFNPTTEIKFQVPQSEFVTLKIYDLLGREVATLVNERKSPGVYSVTWNASGFASGVYLYRLRAGSFSDIRKLVLVK